MGNEPLKGHLDLLLLACLEDGPRHGYAVIEQLLQQSGGFFDLPEGTVYPVLHRLEGAGLLTSRWSSSSGRRRRLYRLTRSGATALAQQTNQWNLFAQAVAAVIGVQA
jgi:PadR family transcriptional regulator